MYNLILTTFVQLDFKVLHSHNLTFTTFVQFDFTVLHLHNLKSLSTISLYTILAQPEFHYILTIWFQGSTLAQPEIFVFLVKWHFHATLAHPKFSLVFHSCYVCMFSYISIFRTHIHVSIKTLPWFESRLFFPCRQKHFPHTFLSLRCGENNNEILKTSVSLIIWTGGGYLSH